MVPASLPHGGHRFDGFKKTDRVSGYARARRSVVDHSLGMGEAPGSNPGESIILCREQSASGANSHRRPDLNSWKSQRRAERDDRLPLGSQSRRVHSLLSVASLRQLFVPTRPPTRFAAGAWRRLPAGPSVPRGSRESRRVDNSVPRAIRERRESSANPGKSWCTRDERRN